MKKQVLILFTALFCVTLSAQRKYTVENAAWFNPWIGSGNMAALVGNTAFLQDAGGSVSEAALGFDYSTGNYKNIYTPLTTYDGNLRVESFLNLDKVNLYGRFAYNYDYGEKSSWRGSVRPYESPFALADSIPGNLTKETYDMQAGISVPLGKWALGIDLSYNVGIMAKLKDLRNRNTDMTFRIAPSVMYKGEHFSAGLHAGYELGSEKIEYTKIADNTDNYLFYLYGLWLYNSYSYSNAETSRLNDRSHCFGGFQFDVRFSDWTLFNALTVDWGRGKQTETGYNNLIYGNTESLTISDKLVLQKGLKHRFTASVSSRELTGERFLQRQELDPASNVRRWVTYGDALPCYARFVLEGSLEYNFRQVRELNNIPWELTVGATDFMASHQYSSYPLRYLQKINYLEPYASYVKRLYLKGVSFSVNPTFAYRIKTSAIEDDVKIAEGAVVSGDPASMQLSAPLKEEFAFWSASCLKAGLKLGFETGRLFGGVSYRYDYAPKADLYRHNANITIGISF